MDRGCTKGFPQLIPLLQYPSATQGPAEEPTSPLLSRSWRALSASLTNPQWGWRWPIDLCILALFWGRHYIMIVITIIPHISCCVSGSGSWANHSNTLVLPCHQRWWDCCELLCHVVLSLSYTFLPLHFENLKSHLFMVLSAEQREGGGAFNCFKQVCFDTRCIVLVDFFLSLFMGLVNMWPH